MLRRTSVAEVAKTAPLLIGLMLLSPARGWAQPTPFQFQAELTLLDGQPGSDWVPIPVPVGMRLVIETVTVRLGIVGGREPHVMIETVLNGAVAHHEVALSRVFDSNLDVWTATHDVRLYTDAGAPRRNEGPMVVFARFGSAGGGIARVTISGYLVQ